MIYLYDRLFPSDGREPRLGVEKAVHGLSAALAASGEDVTVLTEDGPTAEREQAGYTVRSFARTLPQRLAPGLREYLTETAEPGVVVLNGMFHPSMIQMSRLLRATGRPYIVAPHTVYNDALFARNSIRKQVFWHLFERRMLADAAAIQHLDARHASFLVDRGIRTPWFALPNGCPDVALDTEWRPLPSGAQSGSEPARLIHFGRLDLENKGLDLLMSAVAEHDGCLLTLQGPDSGDGPAIAQLAESLGIGDRVSMLGPDFDRDPVAIISEHDVLCLTSRWEGFGLSALEAMIAARPVLITDSGGLVEPVRQSRSGVVTKANLSGVSDGLSELMNRRDEWSAMGMRGRRHVAETLTWSVIAKRATAHYAAAFRPGRRAADRGPKHVTRRARARRAVT